MYFVLNTAAIYDEFLFSIVSKGVANGGGWRLFYPEVLIDPIPGHDGLFNPEAAAGPIYVLFLTVGMWLFGNQHWVPGAINIALVVATVGIIFRVSGSNLRTDGRVLFVILLFVASTDVSVVNVPLFGKFLHKSYGDVWASLLMLLACLLVFDNKLSYRNFYSGFVASISVLVKFLPFLSWLCFVFVFFLRSGKRRLGTVAPLILIPTVFLCAWSLIKFLFYQEQYNELVEAERYFFYQQGSGFGPFLDAPNKTDYLVAQANKNLFILSSYYGGFFAFSLLVVWCVACFFYSVKKALPQFAVFPYIALMFFLQLTWEIFFMAAPWERHLITGAVFISYLLVVSLKCDDRYVRYASFAVIILYIFSKSTIVYRDYEFNLSDSISRLKSQIATEKFIQENKQGNIMGCDWAANRDMEYLLSGNGNIKNCRDVVKLTNNNEDQLFFLSQPIPGYCCDIRFETIKAYCEKNVIFHSSHHTLSRCGTAKDLVNELKSKNLDPFP